MGMTFRSVGKSGPYPQWVRELREKSGVYVIRLRKDWFDDGGIVYVGESHSDNLKKTLVRHFQAWNRTFNPWDLTGWTKHTGHVYDRAQAEVAVFVTSKKRAVQKQYELIQKLSPRDNEIRGDGGQRSESLSVDDY